MRWLFTPEGERALDAVMRRAPLLAFDFDGTLAPIVRHPDDARIAPAEAALLLDKTIAGCKTDDVPEIRSLGDTLARWRTEILAHHTTGASNGPSPRSRVEPSMSTRNVHEAKLTMRKSYARNGEVEMSMSHTPTSHTRASNRAAR